MELKDNKASVKLQALILIGGRSKRMGQDKSLLDYHGKPQWQYLVTLLEKHVEKVYISIRDKKQDIKYPDTITDEIAGLGPFGAIFTALKMYPDKAFLVLATDLPFVDEKLIEKLVSSRDSRKNATALKGITKDYPEPLLCIWEPAAFPTLQKFFKKEIYKPIQVLKDMPIHTIYVDNHFLQNINTIEEYHRIKEELRD